MIRAFTHVNFEFYLVIIIFYYFYFTDTTRRIYEGEFNHKSYQHLHYYSILPRILLDQPCFQEFSLKICIILLYILSIQYSTHITYWNITLLIHTHTHIDKKNLLGLLLYIKVKFPLYTLAIITFHFSIFCWF